MLASWRGSSLDEESGSDYSAGFDGSGTSCGSDPGEQRLGVSADAVSGDGARGLGSQDGSRDLRHGSPDPARLGPPLQREGPAGPIRPQTAGPSAETHGRTDG